MPGANELTYWSLKNKNKICQFVTSNIFKLILFEENVFNLIQILLQGIELIVGYYLLEQWLGVKLLETNDDDDGDILRILISQGNNTLNTSS